MNTAVKNIFGVAAAILVLLGFNYATENNAVNLPEYDTNVTASENRSVATLKDINDAIVDIAEKTNPSVVTITTEKTQEVRVVNPFEQFFGMPGQGQGETRERVRRGLGSGVIVDEDGYILTNNHVIENTDEINVRLFNGDEVEAELIGTDPYTDIAVLKVDVDDLPAIEMGNSDNARIGSFVLAIGSPLGENLAHTVSFGIVSARNRTIGLLGDRQTAGYEDFIQTDAAINPGNSGGALIDMNGELVGINSAIASRSGGNDGIGFAIPVNMAKRIMDDLIEDGEVSRGYLGILPADVDQVMAQALDLGDVRGVLISRVEPDTPAEEAGLEAEDVIVSVNGEDLTSGSALSFRNTIAGFKPGEEIELGVIRDGKELELSVTLGERTDDVIAESGSVKEDLDEKLGFRVTELTSDIKRQLSLSNDVQGVIVNKISEASEAAERGLRKGDVITAVKRKKVSTPEEFYKEIEESVEEGDKAILLTVERNNLKQFIAFRL
jgi:serine protease Do